MNRFETTPSQYHGIKFDRTLLPDVAAAGPVSASLLSSLRDPLSFLLGVEKFGTGSMRWGDLVDCLWLTPEDFDLLYVIQPPELKKPTKAQREAAKPQQKSIDQMAAWDTFEASANGKTVIKKQAFDDAMGAVRMLNQHPIARAIYEDSDKQVGLMGPSPFVPEGDIIAKALLDLLPRQGTRFGNFIADLKTTHNPSDHEAASTMWRFEYHMKMAYYGVLAEAAGLGVRDRAVLIWQRSKFPFDVHVREINPVDLAVGRELVVKRMNVLFSLDATRISDHFDTDIGLLSLTEWQRASVDLGADEPDSVDSGTVD